MLPSFRRLFLLPLLGLMTTGCEYAGLLRPRVLSQLDPPTVRLLNKLPEVDRPNEATVARLFATGGLAHAEPGSGTASCAPPSACRLQTISGIRGNPVSYSTGGKQYVAVPSGWGDWMKGFAPELFGAPRGNALFVFALP
jgi:hypothetical protein